MIELFEHNQKAYQSVLEQLDRNGKAAVIHPTGTGKSFIAFKLVEDNPQAIFVWLSPSENIWNTQLENVKNASGFIPENVTFMTYARLMNEPEGALKELHPDYIILDEFHRAGAAEWGKGVISLIGLFPDAKLLGLSATNIRYLDHQRDMAEELFENCIADQMSLAEAVASGILPAPKYVVSFYKYSLDEKKYKTRFKRVSLPVRRQAEKYLERLRRAIENAEGLDKVFRKHMTDPHGKYIVFCAGYDHMQEMMKKSSVWFENIDPDPHFYSVWSESVSAQRDYKAFQDDESDHLRLLFCIDMFNEGIHVEDISGVILFRPTISPIIYKQQIGRALSSMKRGEGKTPVIFDVVNNFENLYTISSLQNDIQTMMTFRSNESFGNNADELSSFQIIDEVRECRELFNKLEDTLGLSWEMMFRQAKAYYEANGHLNVSRTYRTEDGIPLGVWIMTQRRIRNGTFAGPLDPVRIQRLDSIGMDWRFRSETTWEQGLKHAKEYYNEHGNLEVTSRYKSPDGFRLGSWIQAARARYSSPQGREQSPLVMERHEQLTALNMVWDRIDYYFQKGFQAAEEYVKQHGNLLVPRSYITEDGFKLGEWLESQRKRRNRLKTTDTKASEDFARLDSLGMVWQSVTDQTWEKTYKKAEEYYIQHHNLVLPSHYKVGRTDLWKWINRQRAAYKNGNLDKDKITRLEQIGIQWETREKGWEYNYDIAKAYFETHGDLEAPYNYVSSEGVWLSRWLYAQRISRREGALTEEQIRALDAIHMRWIDKNDQRWNDTYIFLKEWISDRRGIEAIPKSVCTKDGINLYQWAKRQEMKSQQGKLLPDQQKKWDTLNKQTATA